MYNVEGVGQVNGGSLPTEIWTKFMKAAIGDRCRDFAAPKNPFVSKTFTGKYAEEGKAEGQAYDNETDKKKKKSYTEGKKKATDNGGGGGGGGGNDTPQQTPEQPETQAPVTPGGAGPGQ
jgi:membrane carboxypeptidase/penicillin-binding protein